MCWKIVQIQTYWSITCEVREGSHSVGDDEGVAKNCAKNVSVSVLKSKVVDGRDNVSDRSWSGVETSLDCVHHLSWVASLWENNDDGLVHHLEVDGKEFPSLDSKLLEVRSWACKTSVLNVLWVSRVWEESKVNSWVWALLDGEVFDGGGPLWASLSWWACISWVICEINVTSWGDFSVGLLSILAWNTSLSKFSFPLSCAETHSRTCWISGCNLRAHAVIGPWAPVWSWSASLPSLSKSFSRTCCEANSGSSDQHNSLHFDFF